MHRVRLLAIGFLVASVFAHPACSAGAKPPAPKLMRPAVSVPAALAPLTLAAPPLPASPATGTLEAGVSDDDVFAVELQAGQRFHVELTGDAGTDIDLYLLWPGSESLLDPYAASAFSQTYPETLEFDAPVSGTYFLDIYRSAGSGPYGFTHSASAAVGAGRVSRQHGPDRFATALEISKSSFPPSSSKDVVLASGLKYPDALAASALAGALGCPLLITHDLTLSRGVLTEIRRVDAEEIHIVGGPAAVSDSVRTYLQTEGLSVNRYAGEDRYATARIVAGAVREFATSGQGAAFLASGEVFADALSASPIAYRWALPILLTPADRLSGDARAAIESYGITTVYVAGGPAAVSDDVQDQLARMGLTIVRVGGVDRYETSAKLADYAIAKHWADPSYVGVASGIQFPDALTGGAAAGAHGGVVVLNPTPRLGSKTRSFLRRWKTLGLVDDAVMYGGPVALGDAVRSDLEGLLAP